MIVAGALPLLALALTWLRFASTRDWRYALLCAGIVGGLLVTASTEILSLLGQFRFSLLAAFWVAATCVVAVAVLRRGRPALPTLGLRLDWRIALAALPFAVILAATLLVAVIAPPNTWDSMTYHMARVAHWTYQGSVGNYPTETLRQLYQPPFAEFAIAQLQILTGGDHLANLVQWWSMIGSIAGVSWIARELGAPARGQYLAAAIATTLPMGIMQATSTQNDYVESFWLVCGVAFCLRLRNEPDLESATGLAASVGLAILTKGTAYIYGLPILAVAAWLLFKRYRFGSWRYAALLAIAVLLINTGAWVRNVSAFGSVLGPPVPFVNQVFSAQEFASNVIRDASVQVGTPSGSVNYTIARAISRAHRILGIDVNDPRTTWPGVGFGINRLGPYEDSAPDPLQLLLLLVAAVVLALNPGRRKELLLYLGGLLAAFVLFALLIRWQPWHSRLELPFLVLGAPVAAAVFTAVWSARTTSGIAALVFVCAIPWLGGPSIRPIAGSQSVLTSDRSTAYFDARPELRAAYRQAADDAHSAGCHVVGIVGSEDTWEYPLWVYLGPGYRVVPTQPVAGTQGQADPQPCLTFVAG